MNFLDYQHTLIDGEVLSLPVGKIVCVGRNYLKHIQELKNAIPDEPVIFIKPVLPTSRSTKFSDSALFSNYLEY